MQIAINGRSVEAGRRPEVRRLIQLLQDQNAVVRLSRSLAGSLSGVERCGTPFTCLPNGTDGVISLGGDGTFLESVLLVGNSGIPVLGINTGRLGFLANTTLREPEKITEALLHQRYTVEERLLLQASGDFLPQSDTPYALNEIGIQKSWPAMITVKAEINGEALPDYWADGLLVSTPTGSTAYSMSVGGPIVAPGVNCLLLSPIASHNLSTRPLVVDDQSVIKIRVITRNSPAILSLDNRTYEVVSGTEFTISKAPFTAKTLRLSGSSFFSTLHEKLLWGTDKRNTLD